MPELPTRFIPRIALITLATAIVMLAVSLSIRVVAAEQTVESGQDQSFLSASLLTPDGNSETLKQHMVPGRWTLVMIWSVNCHVCQHETGTMSDFHDANKDSLATVLGLSLDGDGSGAAVEQFGEKYDMRFPTLIGDLVPLASSYQMLTTESLRGTPTFMLFNPEGVLQGINPGPLRPEAVLEYIKRKS